MTPQMKRTGAMACVMALDMPLEAQVVAIIDQWLEKVSYELSTVFRLHDHEHGALQHQPRTISVAERNFYLQKHWGG